jgi:MoxR-like ATPase
LDHTTSKEDMIKIGGQAQWAYMLQWIAGFTDNVQVVRGRKGFKASYVDPNPTRPQSVSIDLKNVSVSAAPAVADTSSVVSTPVASAPVAPSVEAETWPECPPTPAGIGSKFRKPSWFETMKVMVACGRHIALSGAPGVGKDTAIEQLAADNGKVLVTVGGDGGLRKRDLVGSTEIVNGSTTFKVAEFAAAVVNGWWASITEINAADADVVILLNALMAAPYIININGKAYKVHRDFRLFVSYNPGLIGTKPLPQSFKDRFFSILVPWFTSNQLKGILVAHGLKEDSIYAGQIVEFGMALWSAYERGQTRYQVTSRRLMDAVMLLNANVTDDVKVALKLGVLAAIDSPVDYKAAETVLTQMFK